MILGTWYFGKTNTWEQHPNGSSWTPGCGGSSEGFHTGKNKVTNAGMTRRQIMAKDPLSKCERSCLEDILSRIRMVNVGTSLPTDIRVSRFWPEERDATCRAFLVEETEKRLVIRMRNEPLSISWTPRSVRMYQPSAEMMSSSNIVTYGVCES
jgi:hypothetical protein